MKEIIVISAVWCPSCLILKKHLKKLTQDFTNIKIEMLDYDFDEDEVKELNIGDKLPVIISISENKEKNRLVGEKDYSDIVKFLKEDEII